MRWRGRGDFIGSSGCSSIQTRLAFKQANAFPIGVSFQFTHPQVLILLPIVWAWVLWLAWKSDVQIGAWRRWTAMAVRLFVALLLVLAVAGIRWMKPLEGVNVFFLL